MKVIHLLRKPCSEGTVAANVLRWGTGAMNIDATRVGFVSEADEAESKTKNQHADFGSAPVTGNVAYSDYSMVAPKNYNPPGRWPANLVLQHLDGCRQVGMQSSTFGGGAKASSGFVNGYEGDGFVAKTTTVPVWACAAGCPVAALDAQGGVTKSTGGRIGNAQGVYTNQGRTGWSTAHEAGDPGFGDTGGASRYFKQVKP